MNERLLTVSPDFHNSPGGGAVVGELLRNAMGIESLHITPGTSDRLIRLRAEKVLGGTILATYLPLTRGSRRSLTRFLSEWSPTIVHANGFGHPLVDSIAELAVEQGLRVVVTVHGLVSLDTPSRRVLEPALNLYLRRRRGLLMKAAAVTCPLEEVASSLQRISSRGIDVIHWGVRSSPAKVEVSTSHSFPAVIALGRLSAIKRYHLLLRAFSRLREDFGDATLTIVGGTSDRGYQRRTEEMIRDLNLGEAVHLTGSVSSEAARERLNASHIYVSVSSRETFGLATLEACADGIPVVATMVGAAPNLVTPETGRLLPVDADEVWIARSISEVAKNYETFKAGAEARSSTIRTEYAWEATVGAYRERFGLAVSETRRMPSGPLEEPH